MATDCADKFLGNTRARTNTLSHQWNALWSAIYNYDLLLKHISMCMHAFMGLYGTPVIHKSEKCKTLTL